MKGTFDFFNYNYSAMISIFAALMGMAYPLILQTVQRIDEVYQSTLLTKYVQEQLVFKKFNVALISAVIVSFLSSFIIAVINDVNWILYVEFIHTLTIVYLSYAFIKLFRFILRANNPDDLFDYIKSNDPYDDGGKQQSIVNSTDNPPKGIVEIYQIAKYASAHESYNLYRNCMEVIIPAIQKGIKNGNHSKEVWTVMYELCNQLKREKDSFFTSDCFIRDIYFYNDESVTFSEYDLKYIWNSLSGISKGKKDTWVYEYWSSANQFYRFRLENNSEPAYRVFITRFKEFHVMLGAMLIYNKKWSLLGDILSFTNEYPPRYPLIPGTYRDIINSIETLDSYSDRPLLLEQRYSIPGMGRDLNTDQKILSEAYRYHALLIIRLNQLPNYWYHINKYAIPNINEEENLNDIAYHSRIVHILKRQVKYWYNECNISILNTILGEVPTMDDILKLLEDHIDICNKRKDELKNTDEVDFDKIKYIKDELKKQEQSHPVHLPMKNDMNLSKDYSCKVINTQYISYRIDGEIIRKGSPRDAANIPEMIISQLNNRLYQEYNNIFLMNPATLTVRIKYEEIKDAFNKLGVDGNYVILSNVYLDTLFVRENVGLSYNGSRIFGMTSNTNSILILKKENVPYISLDPVEVPNGLTKLSDEDSSYLYTNIDTITKAINDIGLTVFRSVRLYTPDNQIRYVRLNISDYSNDISELEKLEHFIL